MTREEEKLKAADEYAKSRIKQGQGRTGDVFPAFIEGSEWEDETMIEKACKWLEENYMDYAHNTLWAEYLINDFKEAMEE